MKLHSFLLLTPCLAQVASKIYTGFNYGRFWGVESIAKQKADFLDGFKLAKDLSTSAPFDSARLFSCVQMGTKDEPSEAFDAAVETNTNLLLGFWISPAVRGGKLDENVNSEMAALGKAFQQHGQALADLVIGLAVGNEDIYRQEDTLTASGLTAVDVSQTIIKTKKAIAESSFAKYMKDKPIGHVDTAKHAVVDNADFIGMTAYPYWNKESIAAANASFHGSLKDVEQRAGNTPVWITEMGWPFVGKPREAAEASFENVQKFWTDVGCSVFGKYTTFWFELLKDSNDIEDQTLDWGLIDRSSRQPRIKDLRCPGTLPSASGSPPASSPVPPIAATSIQPSSASPNTLPSQPAAGNTQPASTLPANSSSLVKSTVHINTTIYITKQPTAPTPVSLSENAEQVDESVVEEVTVTLTTTITVKPTPSPSQTSVPIDHPWCNTVADIDRNGNFITIGGGPAGPDGKCSMPTTYNGFPYGTSDPSVTPSRVPIGTPLCITEADIDGNGRSVPVSVGPAGPDGKCSSAPTYTGWPYVGTQTAVTPSSNPRAPCTAIVVGSSASSIDSAAASFAAPGLPVSSPQPSPPPAPSRQPVVSSPVSGLQTSSNSVLSISFSVHSYCQRKSSRLSQSPTAFALSAPPVPSAPSSHASVALSTTSSRPNNGTGLSGFTWPKHSATPKQGRMWSFPRRRDERSHIYDLDCED